MAILTMFEIHGDPDELTAKMDQKIEPTARRAAAENGGISSTVVRIDEGILIVNHWENVEGMEEVSAEVGPIARDAGLGAPQNWRQFEVLRHRRPAN
jgi:hypothetical protein